MGIIRDSDVVIRGERETFDIEGWLAAYPDEQFQIAAITIAELWHGVERATVKHRAHRESYLQKILLGLSIIPYTEFTAFQHARIWAFGIHGPHDRLLRLDRSRNRAGAWQFHSNIQCSPLFPGTRSERDRAKILAAESHISRPLRDVGLSRFRFEPNSCVTNSAKNCKASGIFYQLKPS